jgi:L-lactate dehydrogenase (cytochrome)
MQREPRIQMQALKEHSSKESCWILIHNKVYDVTKFLNEHPGGQ